jgi:hypothetical protein
VCIFTNYSISNVVNKKTAQPPQNMNQQCNFILTKTCSPLEGDVKFLQIALISYLCWLVWSSGFNGVICFHST